MRERTPSMRRGYPAAYWMNLGLVVVAGYAVLAIAAASIVLWLTG